MDNIDTKFRNVPGSVQLYSIWKRFVRLRAEAEFVPDMTAVMLEVERQLFFDAIAPLHAAWLERSAMPSPKFSIGEKVKPYYRDEEVNEISNIRITMFDDGTHATEYKVKSTYTEWIEEENILAGASDA